MVEHTIEQNRLGLNNLNKIQKKIVPTLTYWTLLILLYYPLSPELQVISDSNSSQPKVFDYLYTMGFIPLCLTLLFNKRYFKYLYDYLIFTLVLVALFAVQYLQAAYLGDYLPNVLFLLRYIQYSSYLMVILLGFDLFGLDFFLKNLVFITVLETGVFLLNSLLITNPLDQNIIASFRGSPDAGAFFILQLSLYFIYSNRIRNLIGSTAYNAIAFLAVINCIFSSSRTAFLILIFFSLILLRKTKTILLFYVGFFFTGFSGLFAKKINLILSNIFSMFDFSSNSLISKDSSLNMRYENFQRLGDFISAHSNQVLLPIIGSGPGYFQRFVRLYDLPGTFDCYPVRVFSEFGLLGLVFFAILLYYCYRTSIIMAGIVLILSLTSDVIVSSKVVPIIVLIIAIGMRRHKTRPNKIQLKINSEPV